MISDLRSYYKQIANDNYNYIKSIRLNIPETFLIEEIKIENISTNKPIIKFLKTTTLDAVDDIMLENPSSKITILNFANGMSPTGGYLNGAIAQEEDLCRRMPTLASALFLAKRNGLFPFGASSEKYSSIFYSKNVPIIRDKNLNILESNKWNYVDVISAVAPNINIGQELDNTKFFQTIINIFLASLKTENNIIIVGAIGCGAFGNDPKIISKLFNIAIKNGLANGYEKVYFAIPPGKNYDIFYENIENKQ